MKKKNGKTQQQIFTLIKTKIPYKKTENQSYEKEKKIMQAENVLLW